MKKSEWSDKQLEDLLRQMPKVHDHRNPYDIYQNLSTKVRKRKSRVWIMPVVAAISVLLLFIILSPGLFSGQFSSRQNSSEKSADQSVKLAMGGKEAKKAINRESSSSEKPENSIADSSMKKTALYEEEVGKGKILTYWIPNKQGQFLVPVSTIVNPQGGKSWIELLNDNMSELKEEQWSLSEYFPLQATLKLDQKENAVIVDVPVTNPYVQGATSETNFEDVLLNVVQTNSDVKKIKLTTAGKPGILFSDYGEKKEIPILPLRNRAYFFYFPEGKELPFLVPVDEPYKDILAAIAAMQKDIPNLDLKASLGSDFQTDFAANKNNTLFIKMDPNSKMEDNSKTLYGFEALLLTAKDFGFDRVKLENAPINKLGPFDLTVENKVPSGANYRPLK